MYMEELRGGEEVGCEEEEEEEEEEEKVCGDEVVAGGVLVSDVKRVLIGAGARALFYPTLLYNVVRNKIQVEFRWWDWIDEFVLLGAVPFPADVERLKALGVCGVITLNEPYETLVPTCLYLAHDIDHLVLPTRDYLFAPPLSDICQAVDFIHGLIFKRQVGSQSYDAPSYKDVYITHCTRKALCGQTTYVHCKAGRGRSTTVVICYLVKYKQMTPETAYSYVKSIRPRVLLASSQWQAVQEFYNTEVKMVCKPSHVTSLILKAPKFLASQDLLAFDDGSVVVITEDDLVGYDPSQGSGALRCEIWTDLSLVLRIQVVGQAALARLSCKWLWCQSQQHNVSTEKMHTQAVAQLWPICWKF